MWPRIIQSDEILPHKRWFDKSGQQWCDDPRAPSLDGDAIQSIERRFQEVEARYACAEIR